MVQLRRETRHGKREIWFYYLLICSEKILISNFLKHHPDHIAANPESTEEHIKKSNDIFIQINEAYEILGNKEKRILYHQELAAEEIIKTKQKFTKYDPDIGFKVVDLSGATAEERARVLHGWTVDKDYYEKQKKSNLKVAFGIGK